MIPLGGDRFPTTPAELADALRAALREVVRLPDELAAVSADADRLRIDLSDGVVTVRGQPEDPAGVGQTQPGPSFPSLEVLAHPLNAEGANLHFELMAADVQFNYDRSRSGRPVLTLAAATDGRFAARISKADLQTLVTAKAREAAQAK